MKAGNAAANGIANGAAKQQRSKAAGMRLYWLKDRVEQGQFKIFWEPGGKSWAGYFKKPHPPSHHAKARPACLKEKSSPSSLQGRAGLAKGHHGAKPGAQGRSHVAKDVLARALGMPAAPPGLGAGRQGWQAQGMAATGSYCWQGMLGSLPGQCSLKHKAPQQHSYSRHQLAR